MQLMAVVRRWAAIDVTENNPDAVIDLVYVVPIPLLDDSQMTSFRSILEMMMNDGKSLLERLVGAHEMRPIA